MSIADSLQEVVAEREVTFTRSDGSSEVVTVRIGKPVQGESPDEWKCAYQLAGFGRVQSGHMMGVDSVQSLLLTLQTILPELDHVAKREGAAFSWLEIPDAGFPDYRLSPSYEKGEPRGA